MRLQEYTESKFLLSFKDEIDLFDFVSPICAPDSFGENGRYDCCSIYFDTPQLDLFFDKIEGEMKKVKLRLRFYKNVNDDKWEGFHLESKCKLFNHIQKRRIPLGINDVQEILTSGFSTHHFEMLFPNNFSWLFARSFFVGFFRPVVTIFFRRRAMISSEIPELRMTFDREISVSPPIFGIDPSFTSRVFNSFLPLQVIFEIKTKGAIPQPLLQKLHRNNNSQISVSKYALGLEHLLERQSDYRSVNSI